jgi:hypothetical protein
MGKSGDILFAHSSCTIMENHMGENNGSQKAFGRDKGKRKVLRRAKERHELENDSYGDRIAQAESRFSESQSERVCGAGSPWGNSFGFRPSIIGGIIGQLIKSYRDHLARNQKQIRYHQDEICRHQQEIISLDAENSEIGGSLDDLENLLKRIQESIV